MNEKETLFNKTLNLNPESVNDKLCFDDNESNACMEILGTLDFSVEKHTLSEEAIIGLETANFSFTEKVPMLLAAMGEKPASLVCTGCDLNRWSSKEVFETESRVIVDTAEKLGLYVCVKDDVEPEDDAQGRRRMNRHFCLSRSEENANILNMAYTIGGRGSDADELILGKVLGFPDTAITAFVTGEDLLRPKELPTDTPDLVFAQFMMSRSNFKQELLTVHGWSEAVKSASPAIYDYYKYLCE